MSLVDNTTANHTSENLHEEHSTNRQPTFLDPGWQLAFTVEFYFQYALIVIGVVGTAANALVLYALISHNAGQAKTRAVNLLIINQNSIDLTCCILLIITFSVRATNVYLTGTFGYLICVILTGETAIFCAINASIINLISVTVQRYLKVVHPFWSKRHLKRWMIRGAIVFAWMGGPASMVPVAVASTTVHNGICWAYFAWASPAAGRFYLWWNLVAFFVVPVIIFVCCYGRIVVVMKRQVRVMSGHSNTAGAGSAQPTASEMRNRRIKWNIIKTMIIVSVAFVLSWLPVTIYFFIIDHAAESEANLSVGYFATLFLAYVNICLNPFIYAMKHEGVKEKLIAMVRCFRSSVVVATSDASVSTRNNPQRIQTVGAGS